MTTKIKTEFCAFLIILVYMLFPLWLFINQALKKVTILDKLKLYNYQYFFGIFLAVFLLIKIIDLIIKKQNIKLKYHIPVILFMGFILLAVISTIIQSSNTHYTDTQLLFGIEARKEGIISYIIYIMLFIAAREVNKPIYKKILAYTFISIGVFIAIIARISFNKGKVTVGVNAISGVFLNSNHYGYYLAMLFSCAFVMMIFKVYNKSIFMSIGLLLSVVIFSLVIKQNASMGTFVACFFAVIFTAMFYAYKHKIFLYMLLIIFAFMILCLVIMQFAFSQNPMFLELKSDIFNIIMNTPEAKNAGSGRWELWILTMNQIKEKPLIGWGIEGIVPYLKEYAKNGTQRTHNEYLQYTAFFGIPAGLLYLSGVISVFAEGFKKNVSGIELAFMTGAFAYAVNAVVGVSMLYIAPQFFILLGLCMNKGEKNENFDC